jgi:hypothetical protein
MDLGSTHVFSMKKVDNRGNQLTNNPTLGDQLRDSLQGSESCDATSHAQALTHSYISCLK